jgi:hypothetical protein
LTVPLTSFLVGSLILWCWATEEEYCDISFRQSDMYQDYRPVCEISSVCSFSPTWVGQCSQCLWVLLMGFARFFTNVQFYSWDKNPSVSIPVTKFLVVRLTLERKN